MSTMADMVLRFRSLIHSVWQRLYTGRKQM
jgi:hypothetical protein